METFPCVQLSVWFWLQLFQENNWSAVRCCPQPRLWCTLEHADYCNKSQAAQIQTTESKVKRPNSRVNEEPWLKMSCTKTVWKSKTARLIVTTGPYSCSSAECAFQQLFLTRWSVTIATKESGRQWCVWHINPSMYTYRNGHNEITVLVVTSACHRRFSWVLLHGPRDDGRKERWLDEWQTGVAVVQKINQTLLAIKCEEQAGSPVHECLPPPPL